MLDGAARVKDLVQTAAGMGMPAIAMTDHGNVFGAFDFYKQAKDAGINPIIGVPALPLGGSSEYRTLPCTTCDVGSSFCSSRSLPSTTSARAVTASPENSAVSAPP